MKCIITRRAWELLLWDGPPGLPVWTETTTQEVSVANQHWRFWGTHSSMSESLCNSSGEMGSSSFTMTQSIKLKSQSTLGSPCGSPRMSPCNSPRNSPRNSPLLFRKLLMNRSITMQRRFTLAHTPRYCEVLLDNSIVVFATKHEHLGLEPTGSFIHLGDVLKIWQNCSRSSL